MTLVPVPPRRRALQRRPAPVPAPTGRGRLPVRLSRHLSHRLRGAEHGMTTAEYAVGTVAACALGALLLKIVTSSEVRSLLLQVIRSAFAPVLG